MTEDGPLPMLESTTDRNYYAVRPALVLSASKLFEIPSSILAGGAKSLHSKAAAIEAGKASGNWGRHQRSVIEQFCEYTRSAGSDYLLPWQELVEHDMNYDQKEGISPRTGNKPLSTLKRVRVDPSAFSSALAKSDMTIAELSARSSLPEAFLGAVESGEWHEISETSAQAIATALGTDIETLFLPIGEQSETVSKPPRRAVGFRIAVPMLLLVVMLFTGWFLLDRQTDVQPIDENTVSNNLWHVSIFLENKNLPIDDSTLEIFENGGYLQLLPDGSILFNWFDPAQMLPVPYEAGWKLENQQVLINLDGIVYLLEPGDSEGSLAGHNTTRAFKMVMVPISLGEEFTTKQ